MREHRCFMECEINSYLQVGNQYNARHVESVGEIIWTSDQLNSNYLCAVTHKGQAIATDDKLDSNHYTLVVVKHGHEMPDRCYFRDRIMLPVN